MKLFKHISSPTSRVANIVMWLMPILLLIPNFILDFTEIHYSWTERIINILIPGGIYLVLFASSRRVGAITLWFLPVMILCAFQIVLLFLYGESIIAIDMFLNVLTTNVSEASELLRNLATAILSVCAIYLPAIIASVILSIKGVYTTQKARRITLFIGVILFAIGGIITISTKDYRASRKLFPVNVISNMVDALNRSRLSSEYFDTSADFSFESKASTVDSAGIYVFIIGETSRADNWQLNGYGRETNPLLSQRSNLISFKKALSESNTTHKSVPLLMSHLDASGFGDSIYKSKGIIEAFSEAGCKTAWFSNQQRNGALIDFFGEQADSVDFIKDDGESHFDGDLRPLLESFVESNPHKPLFIVLHTYGSHFNYKERYPEYDSYYAPDNSTSASKKNREGLINAYDNTIRYTDSVLDSIIGFLENSGRPSVLVYQSDHGEDIFDDSRDRFLHASPTPTYWQLHVPMLIWLSNEYQQCHPGSYETLSKHADMNVSSSRSAFHTLVSLAGITTPYYDCEADLTSQSYSEPNRVFLNDYNEATPLINSGIRKPDFDQLEQHGISVL